MAKALLVKAQRAAASAEALLALGDPDGACNRSYYAMFDAARAALLASGAIQVSEMRKTHSAVIAAFGLHLVKTGRVSAALGRRLNETEERRILADYTGDSIEPDEVRILIVQAHEMIACIEQTFFAAQDGSHE